MADVRPYPATSKQQLLIVACTIMHRAFSDSYNPHPQRRLRTQKVDRRRIQLSNDELHVAKAALKQFLLHARSTRFRPRSVLQHAACRLHMPRRHFATKYTSLTNYHRYGLAPTATAAESVSIRSTLRSLRPLARIQCSTRRWLYSTRCAGAPLANGIWLQSCWSNASHERRKPKSTDAGVCGHRLGSTVSAIRIRRGVRPRGPSAPCARGSGLDRPPKLQVYRRRVIRTEQQR